MSKCLLTTLSFSFLLLSSMQEAEGLEICQPQSILPWTPPELANAKPLPHLVSLPPVAENKPTWLVDSGTKTSVPAAKKRQLPMVETDQYVNLGGVPTGETPSQPSEVQDNKERHTQRGARLAQPFSIFRKHH